eukprot:9212503-Pyramimonas_sp.AAC.1
MVALPPPAQPVTEGVSHHLADLPHVMTPPQGGEEVGRPTRGPQRLNPSKKTNSASVVARGTSSSIFV